MNPPLQLRRRKTTRKRRSSTFYTLPDDPRPALPWWLLAVLWTGLFGLYKLAAYLMPSSFS